MHGASRNYRYVWDVSRALDEEVDPVRILTRVDASACPTVGANCHRLVTADAMGMAKVRGKTEVDVDGAGIGIGDKNGEDTTMYRGSGLSVEIKTLLVPICTTAITRATIN